MQAVDPAPPSSLHRARYSASPVLSEAHAPPPASLGGYSFPPPPRTASGDEHALKQRSAAASPAPMEYARPHTGEGNFSYTAQPGQSQLEQRAVPDGFQQPRSMSLAGIVSLESLRQQDGHTPLQDDQQQRQATVMEVQAQPPASLEFSTLGRTVMQRGPVQRVLNSFAFAEFIPGQASHHEEQHHPQYRHEVHYAPQPQYAGGTYRPYTFGTATAPAGHPFARGPANYVGGPPGPPVEWAKPRMSQDDSAIGTSRPYGSPHTPRLAQGGVPMAAHHHGQQQAVYYTPYHPAGLGMIRSTSNQSGLSTFSESTESSHQSNVDSDYEGHHINPSYLNQAYLDDSGYYSSPQAGPDGFVRSSTAGDLHGVANLRLDASPVAGGSARPRRSGTYDKNATIRTYSSGTIKAGSPAPSTGEKKAPKRRVASTIFHPSPQSMLAPGAVHPAQGPIGSKSRSSRFPSASNSPALPSDAEFARMPTKRSRGRRPPTTPDLDLDPEEDPNEQPTQAQLEYVGTTKTGKPKKIFLCKVPGCGKCFKRSEHLKRHVRSIHTNEKPFQCRWPTCGRYFSRHDNLNQHLRIHREPGVTDAEFSEQLRQCFNRNLEHLKQEMEADADEDQGDLSCDHSVENDAFAGLAAAAEFQQHEYPVRRGRNSERAPKVEEDDEDDQLIESQDEDGEPDDAADGDYVE
ncbi:hypothetical protein JCM10213_004468 [Rhodosporidiobolus nylandii]